MREFGNAVRGYYKTDNDIISPVDFDVLVSVLVSNALATENFLKRKHEGLCFQDVTYEVTPENEQTFIASWRATCP